MKRSLIFVGLVLLLLCGAALAFFISKTNKPPLTASDAPVMTVIKPDAPVHPTQPKAILAPIRSRKDNSPESGQ